MPRSDSPSLPLLLEEPLQPFISSPHSAQTNLSFASQLLITHHLGLRAFSSLSSTLRPRERPPVTCNHAGRQHHRQRAEEPPPPTQRTRVRPPLPTAGSSTSCLIAANGLQVTTSTGLRLLGLTILLLRPRRRASCLTTRPPPRAWLRS